MKQASLPWRLVAYAVVLVALGAGCKTRAVKVDKEDTKNKDARTLAEQEASLAAAISSRDFALKVAVAINSISTATTTALNAAAKAEATSAVLDSAAKAGEEVVQIQKTIDDLKVRTTTEKDAIRTPYLAEFVGCGEGGACEDKGTKERGIWGTQYIYDSGHFDVGVGFGGAVDLLPDNGSDDDVFGAAIVLKAYPLGRWWAAVPESDKPGAALEVIEDDLPISLIRRLSFFVGLSVGEFRPDDDREPDIHGPVYITGVAFDIAPQFSIAAGLAFVESERPRGTGKDRDVEVALYVGVLLNAEAVMAMFDKKLTETLKTHMFDLKK